MSVEGRSLLSSDELRALTVPSNARGLTQLAFHLALLGVCGWCVAGANGWTLLPAMLALGIVQAALFAPIHETMHMTAFASPRLNRIVGWLCACPSLLNWDFYTFFHLAHHRHTQDPERDPELMALPTPTTLNGYLWRICAIPYWHSRLTVLAQGLRGDLSKHPYITPRAAPRVVRSIRMMACVVAVSAGLSIALVGWWERYLQQRCDSAI